MGPFKHPLTGHRRIFFPWEKNTSGCEVEKSHLGTEVGSVFLHHLGQRELFLSCQFLPEDEKMRKAGPWESP